MDRVPEPELMDDDEQALAYSQADFSRPHQHFVELFSEHHSDWTPQGFALDLGCGPADVTVRFARRFEGVHVDGVDGSPAMLRCGQERLAAERLEKRIDLVEGYLPGATLPRERYDVVISNSLLHHLNDPAVVWDAVSSHTAVGGRVFVMDLMRPESRERAEWMREEYSPGEPEVLRRDFFHSLLAAYSPDEVRGQLETAGLGHLTLKPTSDRHFIVFGTR